MKRNIKNQKDMMKIKNGRREKRKRKERNKNTAQNILVALLQVNIQINYFFVKI